MTTPDLTDVSPVAALVAGLVGAVSLGVVSLVEFRVIFVRPGWGNVTPQLAAVGGGTLAAASLGSFGLSVYTYVAGDETTERDDKTGGESDLDIEVRQIGPAELTVNVGDQSLRIDGRVRDREEDDE